MPEHGPPFCPQYCRPGWSPRARPLGNNHVVVEGPRGVGADRWDSVADSYGSSSVVARLAQGLVELVAIRPGESVVDVGTGTGLALIAAVQTFGAGRAVGVDRSLRMLQVARERAVEAGLANSTWLRADAAQLPLRDATFDVAVAASVWQFLAYSDDALADWRRVLRPGGRLGMSVPGPGSGASIPADLRNKYFPRLDRAVREDFLSRASTRPVPDLVEAVTAVGFREAVVVERSWVDFLPTAEAWWAIQWTHAVRFFLQGLDEEALEMLKAEAFERLERSDAGEIVITTKVIYCVAKR
jgi:ubiquinone/menaquinone biosynthesis C-methylase UbiE